ncbi:MAG: hypothetical protein JNJ61_25560 [Anaerolineae bacterium]|nr:hypothetical protein [Anaerolineae bacterium]
MSKRNVKNAIGVILPLLALVLANLACDLERSASELNGSQVFEARGGWDYSWYAPVDPGRKYQVTVSSTQLDYTGGFLVLEIANGLTCSDCALSTSGTITRNGIRTTFVAPESGRVRINAYVREGTYECKIEISPIGS